MLKLTPLAGFGASRRPADFELTIGASTADVDLHGHLAARGYRNEPEVAVTVAAGVQVYSTTTAKAGLTVDLADFPRGCRIVLTVLGEICGRGGASGAAGGRALEVAAGPGNNGGAALAIDNRGEINGGGGGGRRGGGDSCSNGSHDGKSYSCSGSTTYCAGGAGGTGYGPNAATRGASGQSGSCGGCGGCRGGSGRNGGGKGQAGGGNGGAAGAAVTGNANIEWTNEGVRNGPVR
ncbi:MAG: hypothetical protein F4114_15900 [Rhodospirillaceae bacterium]|nr:hypothetical protein [Rhodospirillaceae bacterium]MYB11909.1 hypothetical protein [Rhodospirillaceae bacterium]MYI50554.1 hypothetical protein [Rhodospirillaceae bacterium]